MFSKNIKIKNAPSGVPAQRGRLLPVWAPIQPSVSARAGLAAVDPCTRIISSSFFAKERAEFVQA